MMDLFLIIVGIAILSQAKKAAKNSAARGLITVAGWACILLAAILFFIRLNYM